jgi:hypothetical protein
MLTGFPSAYQPRAPMFNLLLAGRDWVARLAASVGECAGQLCAAERDTIMKRMIRGFAGAGCGLTVVGFAAPRGATAGAAGAASHRVIHVVHVAGGQAGTNLSNNWSGYNIGASYPGEPTGVTFTAAGKWTVLAATQHTRGQAGHSATWAGIGGGCITDNCSVTDSTLIQAGTEQDVSKASHGARWEIIPEPQTKVTRLVTAGDKIKVSVSETTTPGHWSVVIDNLTTGRRFSTRTPYCSSMDTAEWIEETPLIIGTGATGPTAMPNLGTVHFTSASLNGVNPRFQAVDEIQLVTGSGKVVAAPSATGPDLASFNDRIWRMACAAP